MINNYYVYEYIRLDTNEPFYVGKGCLDRCYNLRNRNKYFTNIINKCDVAVNILQENISEEEAFQYECWYIYKYDIVYGYKLANYTEGGEGSGSWFKLISEEEREKHREISKSFLGRTHTKETKEKMRVKACGRKVSEETRKKLKIISKGRKGHFKSEHCTDEMRLKLSEQAKKRVGELNPNYGNRGEKSPLSKPILVIKDDKIYMRFSHREAFYEYFKNQDVSISEGLLKSHLRYNMPFSSRFKKHHIYSGMIFIKEEDYIKGKID